MKKNELFRYGETILRIIDVKGENVFVIDCIKRNMPIWMPESDLIGAEGATQNELMAVARLEIVPMDDLLPEVRKTAYDRFTAVAGVLPYIADNRRRIEAIAVAAEQASVSRQTIKRWLYLFLAHQDIAVLAPKQKDTARELTRDEKNIRWALNKFYYSKAKHSLDTAYTLMLKAKYCDTEGKLLPVYPSFYQFRYYYRKHI